MTSTRLVTCRWIFAFGVALVACAAMSPAQTTRPVATAPATRPATRPVGLDDLIGQLGADDRNVRDAAEARIIEMGRPALPTIDELAADAGDPEVRRRALAIGRQIVLANVIKPSRVTLKFKTAPVRQVYEELFRQAGAALGDVADDDFAPDVMRRRQITVDLKDVTFWEAVVALEAKSGLTVDGFAGQLRLAEAGDPFGKPRQVLLKGPFMVVAEGFGRRAFASLKVFVEPRIRVVGHAKKPEFVPGAGDAAEHDVARRRDEEFEDGGNAFALRFLDVPEGPGGIKGAIRIVVVTREQMFAFDDVTTARKVEQAADGRRVVLDSVTREFLSRNWWATVELHDAGPRFPGHLCAGFVLLDTDGRALSLRNGSGDGGDEDTDARAFLQFFQSPGVGRPVTLLVSVPTETREVQIPFEFKQ